MNSNFNFFKIILLATGLVLASNPFYAQCITNEGGAIINEFSNGPIKNQEFIELLVIGNGSSSTVDLQGYILDDNNQASINVGNEPGHIRLGACFNDLEVGTLILIYNDDQIHPLINLTAEEGTVIIPFSDPCVIKMEGCPNHSDPSYDCPDGFQVFDTDTKWVDFIPAQNNGDKIQLLNPNKETAHEFEWGLPTPKQEFSTERKAYVHSDNFSFKWELDTNATPGKPNNYNNYQYIELLKGVMESQDIVIAAEANCNSISLDVVGGFVNYYGILSKIEPGAEIIVFTSVSSSGIFEFKNLECGDYIFKVTDMFGCKAEHTFTTAEFNECLVDVIANSQGNIVVGHQCPSSCDILGCYEWTSSSNVVVLGNGRITDEHVIITLQQANQLKSNHAFLTRKEFDLSDATLIGENIYRFSEEDIENVCEAIDPNWCVGNDNDGDGICDDEDNCPDSQDNVDSDGDDVCDIYDCAPNNPSASADSDGDGYCDIYDCAPDNPNYYQDSDGDGFCDDDDCQPLNSSVYYGGTCDDGSPCTKNDVYDKNCKCKGELITNCSETCEIGSPCDDNNVCTKNDQIDENCNCFGTLIEDCYNDCTLGSPCDDNNNCTSGDQIDENCNCTGAPVEGCKDCEEDSPCDDGDDCTSGDKIYSDCSCKGEFNGTVDITLELVGECVFKNYILSATPNYDRYEWYWEGEKIKSKLSTINVGKAGKYMVAAASSDGCFYTNEFTVQDFYTAKVLEINASAESICSPSETSETITLSIPNGDYRIEWYGPNDNLIPNNTNTVIINSAGEYYVTVEDEFECIQTAKIEIESNIKNYKIEPAEPTICKIGGEIILSVSDDPGSSFLWSTNETTSSISVFFPNTYSVTVTSDGCQAVDQVIVKLIEDVDLDKVLTKHGFRKERVLITGIEALKGDDSSESRGSVECIINSDQSKSYSIKRVQVDPQSDPIDLDKLVLAEVNRFRCFESDAEGLLVDNFCSQDPDGITLSDFVSVSDVSTFKYFILESDISTETYLYYRLPTFVSFGLLHDDKFPFKQLLYDIVCNKSKGLDLSLTYDTRQVKYGLALGNASFMTSGQMELPAIEQDKYLYSKYLYANYDNFLKLHGLLFSNYIKGGKLITSDPLAFIKGKVDKAILTYHGFKHSVEISGSFYEIKIPYDPNSIDLELDPSEVNQCEEGQCESLDDQYYLTLYIPVSQYDSDIESQSNLDRFNGFFNNTSQLVNTIWNSSASSRAFSLEDMPLCLFSQDVEVCELFTNYYIKLDEALEIANEKLSNANSSYSKTIIDCFDDANLVNHYAKLDNSFFYKNEDTQLYKNLSIHFFNLQNHVDLEVSEPKKTTFLYETFSLGVTGDNLPYLIETRNDHFLLKREGGALVEKINYFDSNKTTSKKEGILLHPAKQFDYLNDVSSWPKKDGKLSNIKVPGIYVAYVVNAANEKSFDKISNNIADIVGLFFVYGELNILYRTGRLSTVGGMLAATEIPLSMTSLFLTNSDDYCYDGDTDFCKNLRVFHRTAQVLLLSGNITNALIPNLKKAQVDYAILDAPGNQAGNTARDKMLAKLDEIDTAPKTMKDDFVKLMGFDLDLFKKLTETFDKILETAQNDKLFKDLIAELDDKDIHKLFELENAIKNLDVSTVSSTEFGGAFKGVEFFQDLIETAKTEGKIGKELGSLGPELVKAWEVLPVSIRNEMNWLGIVDDAVSNHSLKYTQAGLSAKIVSNTSSEWVTQNISDFDQLYSDATEAITELDGVLNEVTSQIGGFKSSRLKDPIRAKEKIDLDPDPEANYSWLTDIAAGRVIYDNLDDFYSAVDNIVGNYQVIRLNERVIMPLETNYRDVL
ncbi:MAG: hypothetical protein ACI86M_000940, partial [Saprospiraceae bacterium]